jgi:hypothetical protein
VFASLSISSSQSLLQYKTVSSLSCFLSDFFISFKLSHSDICPSFAASTAQSQSLGTLAIVATQPSFTPYKGAVVINGILYCPYSQSGLAPADQNCTVNSASPALITPPPPAFFTGTPSPPRPSSPKRKSESEPTPRTPSPKPQPKAPEPYRSSPIPKPDLKRQSTPLVNMPGPAFGALGASFTVTRAMQAVCLISIIGMTANFIAEMVASNQSPPHVLIGTLSVVRLPPLFFFCKH